MPSATEIETFLAHLNERAALARHVAHAIGRAHLGRVPTLRAHALHVTPTSVIEVAEWLRAKKRAKRYVCIAWRLDGSRVTYEAFADLETAMGHARAVHGLGADGVGSAPTG